MNFKTKNRPQVARLLAMTTLGALMASGALAQDGSYTYGGISVGQTHGKIGQEGISAKVLGSNVPAVTVTSITKDDTDNAYRLFLGYQFNRNLGLEASFFNLGRYRFSTNTSPAGQLNGDVKIQGGGLDVVGALPLSENWSLLGRVGGQYAKTRDNFTGSGAVNVGNPAPSARQFNYKVGGGLQYAFGPNFLMRGEAEQYRTRDALGGNIRVQVFSLSAVVPFGAGARDNRNAMAMSKPVAYTPAPAPMPVVPAATAPMAAPAPMVAVAPVAPMPMTPAIVPLCRVSFSAESLFGFDKSTIRPEGKTALDSFARETVGTQFEVIAVEGHADRLGSTAYNQTLSLQRAESVKNYLVSSGGFAAAKVSATGMGENSPTTKAGECKDSLPMAALRSCLQPDRRVDVVVNGTK